jgi:hypothetical protein
MENQRFERETCLMQSKELHHLAGSVDVWLGRFFI